MNNKALIIKRISLSFLTAFFIGFIFYNSSLNADESTIHSTGVRELINNLLSSLNINIYLSEHFVRKCAHCAEYFVLGVMLFFTVKSYIVSLDYKIVIALCVGLLTASVDEIIQLYSDGRSGQLTDVILDFIGVCTAVCILYIIFKCVSKRKTETDRKY